MTLLPGTQASRLPVFPFLQVDVIRTRAGGTPAFPANGPPLLKICTTVWPFFRRFAEPGLHRIVFNVCNCIRKVTLVANVAVEIFFGPELSFSFENFVSLVGGERLDRVHDGGNAATRIRR